MNEVKYYCYLFNFESGGDGGKIQEVESKTARNYQSFDLFFSSTETKN